MALDTDTRDLISSLVQGNRVVLFMKGNPAQPQCGFSAKTVAALGMLVPDYLAVDVLKHPEIREGIKEFGNWPTIPQLYLDGELVGGSDIVVQMFESGELAQALGMDEPDTEPPTIGIEPEVAEIMSGALQGHPGTVIHLKIDAGWEHSLSLAPPKPSSVDMEVDGVRLQLDRWSAARADGLHISVRESLQGQGFTFQNPNAPPPVMTLSARDLRAALDSDPGIQLFDVRTDEERARARLGDAAQWDEAAMRAIDELPKDTPLFFFCHKGGRSRSVAERYRRRGYTSVHNLEGGIDAWSRDVDPQVPRY